MGKKIVLDVYMNPFADDYIERQQALLEANKAAFESVRLAEDASDRIALLNVRKLHLPG